MFTKNVIFKRFLAYIALGIMGFCQVNGAEEEPSNPQNLMKKIIRAKDANAATILLQIFSSFQRTLEAYPDQKDNKELIIFVDIDDTLIKGASDFESFANENKIQPKVISPFLIQSLRNIQDSAEKNQIKVTILGLTSAPLWRVVKQKGTNNISLMSPKTKALLNDKIFIMDPNTQDLDLSSVRIRAMESIGVPFTIDKKQPLKGLPFLHGFQSETISPECKMEGPFQFTFPMVGGNRTEILKFTRNEISVICFKKDNLFIEIKACPVLHNGIISMNCSEHADGLHKGVAVASYLFDRFPDEETDFSTFICIVAIDDNPIMLESIAKICNDFDITFQGINIYQENKEDKNKEEDK